MKMKISSDWKGWVIYPAIILLVFIMVSLITNFPTRVHEIGHYFYGTMGLHASCKMSFDNDLGGGGNTTCSGFPSPITKSQLISYHLSGFYFEIFLYAILFAVPYTSLIGGYLLFTGVFASMHRYSMDFIGTSLEFLNLSYLQPLLVAIGIFIFIFSLMISFYFWKRLYKKSKAG